MNVLISIVVISYNHACFIKECLDSIMTQSYVNWELFVVDDFSKDNSTDIYDNWLFNNNINANKIYHKKNIGLCKTLNEVIPLCKGEYIKLIAADDFLHPDLILESVNVFKQKDSSFGMTYANAEVVNQVSISQNKKLLPEDFSPSDNIFNRLISGNFIPALTVMFKAEVFNNVGFFDENIWIEDWEYWLRVSKKYKCAYIPTVLAYYRVHDSNISKNNNTNMIESEWQILMKYENNGKYKKEVGIYVRELYFRSDQKELILSLYKKYKYKNATLHYMLKCKWPVNLIRGIQKIFSK